MKNLSILLVFVSLVVLTSCGGSKEAKEKTIKVKNVLITGEGNKYIKVVDGTYSLKPVEADISLSIKMETVSKYTGEMSEHTTLGNLSMNATDSLGGGLGDIGLPFSPSSTGDWDKIRTLLTSEPGTQMTITFKWSYFSSKEKQLYILENMGGFEITNTDITNPGGQSNSNANSNTKTDNNSDKSNSNSKVTSNENWDEILDKYEKFATDYIDYTKKIVALQKKGDNASITEVATLMPKAMQLNQDAAELGTKLQNAGSDLTTTQMTRYTKIMTKFAAAALELSKQ